MNTDVFLTVVPDGIAGVVTEWQAWHASGGFKRDTRISRYLCQHAAPTGMDSVDHAA
ncbi:hypothetical protein [Dokdonella sp.]|uniref:hypothetical protein n=1 Tax=Dokdonella sp. TaxID=2291710 RepID=UPI003C553A68